MVYGTVSLRAQSVAWVVFWQKPLSPAEQHMPPPDFFSLGHGDRVRVGAARSERTEQKQPDLARWPLAPRRRSCGRAATTKEGEEPREGRRPRRVRARILPRCKNPYSATRSATSAARSSTRARIRATAALTAGSKPPPNADSASSTLATISASQVVVESIEATSFWSAFNLTSRWTTSFARRGRRAVRRRHGPPDGPSRFDGLIQCFALRRRRRVYRIIAQDGLGARGPRPGRP